MNVMVTMLGSL